MRKSAMRVLACSLAAMVAFSALTPVKTARAEKEVLAAAAKAASLGIFRNRGDDSLLASEGKTLYLTADMADEGQITISGGTYERIVVPKEIGEIKITFDQSEVGELIVESGSTASILLRTTTAAKVTIEEPKLKEIDWTELRHLLTDEQTIQKVIEDYTRLQEENERYRNSAPRIMAAQGAVISSLTAGAGVSLDLKHGEVGSLSVKTGVKLTRTEIAVEGYHGDIAYTGGDSFGIVSLKLKNSEVGRLTVSETCGSNYLLVSGNNSFADNIEVAGNANVSLNIPADALTVTADAEDARVDVLNKVDNMSVAADNARIEIAPIGSVASAEVSGNKVSIGGGGMLGKADLTGEDAYVSTKGTEIEGENTYIPPVYTAPSVTVTPKPTPTEIPVTPPASGDRVTLTGNTVEVSRAEVGDTVRFGSYEQDNDFDNGAEAIEWFVLDKQDGKLLLFSKNALDVKPYHEKREAVTWETCTLRSWLNGEFFHTAFSGTEQGRILTAKGKNEDNPKYGTGGGNDTEDKVFLLSLEEALRYFDPDLGAKDPVRCAKVTEYVKAKGGYYEKNGEHAGNGWWWLRSPGYDSTNVAFVINTGCVDVWGDHVDFEDVVRPAFWLNLESETPTPTPASTSERLTFKFADMKYGGYGYILKEAADGGVHVAFEGQYQEIRFTLPQEIDLAQYDKVVFSMMTATAEDAVALKVVASDAELDLYNNPIPLHTRWGVTTSGVQNVELSLAEYAGKKLNRIGIMANNGAANITLYSVTFVPKEGAGGNIPTPTPGVTGIPTPTPIYLNPPPETPNGLTYKFADMGEPNGYGYKYSAGPYNGVHVAFEGQYQEIRFTLPQEIDLRQYDKVVFSMIAATAEDMVALKVFSTDAELDQYNNSTPMEIKWNVTTSGAENVEVSLAAHADKKVSRIAIIALAGAANITLYSVTFVPKEGAGGNIPTPTPDVTGTPEPTTTPTPTPGVTPVTGSAVFIPSGTGGRVTFTGNTVEVSEAKVGDTVRFGSYEQDNDLGNGAEAIEWLVLDKQDGKLLLLSKDALDAKPYNERYAIVTWETCTLRSWLNGEFYNTAFRQTEQERIATTRVKTEDNRGTEAENDTEDKVFLLSGGEVLNYFDPNYSAYDPARRAKVTEYAKAQGGGTSSDSDYAGNGRWWLRTPSNVDSFLIENVSSNGYVSDVGGDVDNYDVVVRPALWLNLES